MIQLLKRDDSIYNEIEAFKEYEFTYCIAFEMAIRNKDVKKLLKKTTLFNEIVYSEEEALFSYLDRTILPKELEVNKIETLNELSKYGFEYQKCSSYTLTKSMEKIKGHEYVSSMGNDRGRNKLTGILYPDELSSVCHIERSLYNQMPWVKTDDDRLKTDDDFLEMGNNIEEWIFHETSKQIIKEALKRNQIIKIHSYFSRPKLKLPLITTSKINMNLSLPKDELISYISEIKDEYDKDNSIIKTPLELLGEDLKKSDNKHTQKKPKATKWADWFYVYDCYQILKTNDKKKSNETIYNEIDLLLLEHYDSIENHYYSIETYKKTIMKNMNYLIDELGYKELITGVKNK